MIRRRLLELFLYGTGPLAIFITAPILARGLGPVGRGQLGVAQSVASLALALGTLGQAEVLLADRRNGTGNLRISATISMLGGVASALIAAIILFGMNINIALIAASVIFIPILSQSQLWRSISISSQELRAPALNNFVGALLRVVFLGLLILTSILTPGSAMLALQLSTGLAAILTVGYVARRNTRNSIQHTTGRMRTSYISNLLRGLPLVAFTIFTAITLGSAPIALQMFSDAISLGVYTAASSLSMAVLSVSGAFKSRVQSLVFLPNSRSRVSRELALVIVLGSIGAVTAIVTAPWIVQLLLGPGFENAVPLLRVLALSCIGLLVLDTVHGLLAAMGQRRSMVLVGAIGAISTILSLVAFVPTFGAMGAAMASVISCTTASSVGWIIVKSKLT